MMRKRSGFIFFSIFIVTAFAQAENINLELEMPGRTFYPGVICKLDLHIVNDGSGYPDSQLFVALNVGTDDYWFYPSWCHYPSDIDWENISIFSNDDFVRNIIPEFEWPRGAGEFDSATFLSALIYDGHLISNLAQIEFGWRDIPAPTPTSTQTSVPTHFVYVPPGTFGMGSPSDEMCRDSDEGPVHSVTISHGFYIQSTEVTQQQWVDVFGNNPSNFEGMNRPVEEVTWYDCCVYCNRLSMAEGLEPCYYSDPSYTSVFDGTPPVCSGPVYWKSSADGYRLPTEAEWEYACRAGTTTAYNSGRDNSDCVEDPNLDPLAWYGSDSGNETHPAGLKQGNNWGLYDMHGNVWEWCWDWYGSDYYGSSPAADPTGPSSGSDRVVRSGAWSNVARYCRSANRYGSYPEFRLSYLGFRIIRSVQ